MHGFLATALFSSNDLLLINLVLWLVAGVIGFFVGRSGASPGCLIYVLMFFLFGGLGAVTFLLGTIAGRNLRRREVYGVGRRSRGSVAAGDRSADDSRQSPPSGGSYLPSSGGFGASAQGHQQPWPPPGSHAPSMTPAGPGWVPDPADPLVQRFWDGARWTATVRWDGSTWRPL